MTFTTPTSPTVNHTTWFNPNTNQYEIQINIKYDAVAPKVPEKFNTITALTTKDLKALQPSEYFDPTSFNKPNSNNIPSFGLSELNLSELDTLYKKFPVKTTPAQTVTKQGIQNVVNSLLELQKGCWI